MRMLRGLIHAMILVLAAVALTACLGATASEQTLEADYYARGTQIAELRATVTIEADRLNVTVQYMDTEVARVSTQQALLILTLQARGLDTSSLPAVIPQVAGGQPAPGTTPVAPGSQPLPPSGGMPTNTPSLPTTPGGVTPGGVLPQPLITPQAAVTSGGSTTGGVLSEIVTSGAVGADDCALSPTSQFTASTPEIYVVARARNLPDGTTIVSRWRRSDGTELAVFSFSYGFVENACIWFFATPEDFAFTAGSYSVSLEIGGQIIAQTTFTIT
jgi:hypothetical protein